MMHRMFTTIFTKPRQLTLIYILISKFFKISFDTEFLGTPRPLASVF
jgi:hypothetical protein